MLLRIFIAAALATGLASMAFAQRGGGPRGQQENGDDVFGPGAGGRVYAETKLDRLGDMLRLSRDQKNGAKEIFDAAQKEAAPLRDEIQKSRGAIAIALLSQKPQAEVDQLLANHGSLMAQMTGLELRAFAKLCSTLNADQQKRVGPAFTFMTGMFSNKSWNTTGN